MNNKIIKSFIIFFIQINFLLFGESGNENKKESINNMLPTNSSFTVISDEILTSIMMEAIKGDGLAAMRLSYHFGRKDTLLSLYWTLIGIENNSWECRYTLTNKLLNFNNNDSYSKLRGIYWLYVMVSSNYRINQTEKWLHRLGYTLETAKPPDDNNFLLDCYQLSEIEINSYKEGALKGNEKASLVLGKYYSDIKNNELSEYWYRIGAQNGNQECKYILGKILLGKDNEFDKARGEFWLKQAEEK